MLRKTICILLIAAALTALCACGIGNKANEPKFIAITFDDGPEYTWTPAMLDGLAERNVKATFFMVGQWTPGKDEIISRIQAEGHQIGSHTVSHERLTEKTDEQILEELADYEETMRGYTGQSNFWLRPPYGDCDERVASLCNVPVILWSIDPAAGETVPAEEMEETIVREAKDGAIILMHDTTEANVVASLGAIDRLMEEGYVFVTVEQLFQLKGVTPEPGKIYREVKG